MLPPSIAAACIRKSSAAERDAVPTRADRGFRAFCVTVAMIEMASKLESAAAAERAGGAPACGTRRLSRSCRLGLPMPLGGRT